MGGWNNAYNMMGQDPSQLVPGESPLQQQAFQGIGGMGGYQPGSWNTPLRQAMGGMRPGVINMERIAGGRGNPWQMADRGMPRPMSAAGSHGFARSGLSGPRSVGQSQSMARTGVAGPRSAGELASGARMGLQNVSAGQGQQMAGQGMAGPMSLRQGLGIGRGSVQGGSNVIDPRARATLGQFASGANVGGNPELDRMVGRATDQIGQNFQDRVLPGLNATFGGAGRTGSGIHALTAQRAGEDASRAAGDTASRMYGQAYESGRGRQLAAAGQLGGLGIAGSGLGLQGAGLGLSAFNQGQGRQLGVNQLGANIFSGSQGRQFGANQLAEQGRAGDQGIQLGANQLGEQMYSGDQNRQLEASKIAAGMFNQGQNREASMFNQGANRQLQAAQGLMGYGLQGAGLGMRGQQMGMNYDQNRFNMMMGAGGQQRGIQQQQLMAPWTQQGLYSQAIGNPFGASQSRNTSRGTSTGTSSGGIVPGLFGMASMFGGGG